MTFPHPMRAAILVLALAGLSCAQLAEPAGASGYKLLKLDISPRTAALSGAGVARPELEQDLNPAIATPDRTRLGAGWTSGYARLEGRVEHASWAMPAPGGALFGRLRFQGFEDIEGYDAEDRSTGTYTASTWAAGLGYGLSLSKLVPGLSVGLRASGGMNHVASVASWAGWADLGTRWEKGEWAAGATIRNWGLASVSDQDHETLPLQTQLGGSWTRSLPHDWSVSVLADARWTVDEEWTAPLGLESRWGMLALRTGWTLGLEESRPSFGVGVLGDSWGVEASLAWHGALGLSPGMALTAGI